MSPPEVKITDTELDSLMPRYRAILDRNNVPENFRRAFVRFVESGELPEDPKFSTYLAVNQGGVQALEDAFIQRCNVLRGAIQALLEK